MVRLAFAEIAGNQFKSWLMLALFVILIGILGAVFGIYYGSSYIGLILALAFSIVYILIAFNTGDKMILSMSGARPATKQEFPYLLNTLEGLVIAGGIPIPSAYVIDDTALNAFATGKDPKHASVTVTTGLLKAMNRQELEGVIAHEMSHIKNYDIRFMMLTVVLVGVVTLLSDFLLRTFLFSRRKRESDDKLIMIAIVVGFALAILSPLIGQLIKLAVSRRREFLADASGAIMTRYPKGLASALRKIARDADPLVDKANHATAHLFISTPFRKKSGFMESLFSTHPPIEERIKRLEEM